MSHSTKNLDEFANLVKTVPESLMLVVVKDGKPVRSDVFGSSEFRPDEMEYLAKLVDLRFSIVDFDKIFGGLEMTVNIFRHYCIFVMGLQPDYLAVIITKTLHIDKTRQLIDEIRSVCHV